jgi:hypothetical protein
MSDFWKWLLGILGVIFTWVISGVIGFYAALSAVNTDINVLNVELTSVKTKLKIAEDTIKKQGGIESRLKTLEGDFKYVQLETNKMSSTNSAIQYLIEVERNKTVNELKEILKK